MKEGFSYVGRPLPVHGIEEKLTGAMRYAGDLELPRMLAGKILRSPHPHALIAAIDTAAAAKLLGGEAFVATAKDGPGILFGGAIYDMPFFATDKVRYVGEPVAAVAAPTPELADEAVRRIVVKYRELPALFDPVLAMAPGAPLIHEDLAAYKGSGHVIRSAGNICSQTSIRRGDVDQGFREADHLFEDVFHTQTILQGQMEPHAAVASLDSQGRIEVWTPTTGTFQLRYQLSEIFGVALHRICVHPMPIGGSFGAKNFVRIEPYCVVLARKTGCPVKIAVSRHEELTAFNPRHATLIEIKTGVKRDGTITVRKVRLIYDTGAYADAGPMAAGEGARQAVGPYTIPHVEVDSYCVYTNKMSAACCRAHGTPQPTFAFESQMDIIARRLGMDPVALRLKNAVPEGYIGPGGDRYLGVGIRDVLLQAAERIDLKSTSCLQPSACSLQPSTFSLPSRSPTDRPEKRLLPSAFSLQPSTWIDPKSKAGIHRGKGIAVGHWYSGAGASGAVMKLNEDGTVTLSIGAPDATGTDIMALQVAAEELGLPLDRLILASKDTDHAPFDTLSSGSRITHCLGQAVRKASQELKAKILELAAQHLDADPRYLEMKEGLVRSPQAPDRPLSLERLARSSHFRLHGPILATGSYFGEMGSVDRNAVKGFFYDMGEDRTFVAQAAEVEVDGETGRVTVLRLVSANDVGFLINPPNAENQVCGGVYQGLGFALSEEVKMARGKVLNPSFMDYGMLRADDLPGVECCFVENRNGPGPYGAKGLGEQPGVPTAAAIANAVFDAVGVRIRSLPITPEKILRALREKGEGANPLPL